MERKLRRDGRKHLTRRPDGRFRLRYKDQYFYGYTEDDAYARLDEYKALEAAQASARRDPTVQEYATAWLPRNKVGIGLKTYNDYALKIDQVNETIGSMKIKDVTPSDVKRCYLRYEGLSESTIRRTRMLWVSIFESAVADGLIRYNVFKDKTARPHKGTQGTHRVLTQEEKELIDRVDHKLRPLVMVMLYAGLRRGEALALVVDRDVDFTRNIIRVRESVSYNGNEPVLHSGGKTKNAAREIPLPARLRAELIGRTGRLFTGEHAEIATETAFRRAWDSYLTALERAANNGIAKRWWGKTKAQRAGGPPGEWKSISIRPHDLRHTYCTMLRDAGIEMKVAMRWMGHSDERMILKIYDHEEGRLQANSAKLDAFLSGAPEQKAAGI